jgi:DnaJ like chaperone protein
MSIWTRLADLLTAAAARGEGLLAIFDRPPERPEKSVAFTIAIVCLGAKMAKVDGQVKPAEVAAFRRVFRIAPEDEAAAARVYNLARQDAGGFEVYAQRIARLFRRQPKMLEDILEGLFHVALADGCYNEVEGSFLHRVSDIFGISPQGFAAIEARLAPCAKRDPWQVLGAPHDADLATIRARWRKLVRENHPDRMIARGLPPEGVALASARLAAINAAWEEIAARLAPPSPAR